MNKQKTFATFSILFLLIPSVVIFGAIFFKEKFYSWLSLCVAILSCLPLFYAYERRDVSSQEQTVLAVLVAISALGRFVFAWIPGFKPVTALTVIAAVWLGKEAGFIVGSLSAVISNFYFGQGPWTPFQMFAWGAIGFFAGVLSKPLSKNKILLCVYGAFAALFYSATMDTWTVIWADNAFAISRFFAAFIASAPVTAEYAVSNIIFLIILSKPFGDKLFRLKKKYGLFLQKEKPKGF